MISPYYLRLVCLLFASFFLLHAALGVVARLLAPAAVRGAGRLPPSLAANLLFLLRTAPPALAVLLVLTFCLPAYLRWEPDVEGERIGWLCLVAAGLGAALLLESLARAAGAIWHTGRRVGELRRLRREISLAGEPGWIVDVDAPLLGLIGVFRPKVVLSRAVWRSLSAGQLDLAVRHELAHRAAGDNLKRLAIQSAPGLFPLLNRSQPLDEAWAAFAERAADARATAGPPERSLVLADALVRLARLGLTPQSGVVFTSLVQHPAGLAGRIECLLSPPAVAGRAPVWLRASGTALAALLFALFASLPQTLRAVHHLLELLIRG